MSIKMSVYLILTDDKHQTKYQNIKFLTTYCFVFLQKCNQEVYLKLMKPQMFYDLT